MIEELIRIAKQAGQEILKIYKNGYDVHKKRDKSPVTTADIASNKIICSELKKKFPDIPIVSEETLHRNQSVTSFFLIDPLDGTKEFINRNGEFTINIAFLQENKPIMGVIYAPVLGLLYYSDGNASYKIRGKHKQKIIKKTTSETLIVMGSSSHFSQETEDYLNSLNTKYRIIHKGSSIKFCYVADGSADLYPRLGTTMEWDTAAAHAILKTSGANIYDFKTGQELQYNKKNFINNWFIAR